MNETYKFTKDCFIGVKEIDDEHMGLFKLINEVLSKISDKSADETVIRLLIQSLQEYATTHFEHEEAYMKKINDPELERQKKEHKAFSDKLNAIDLESVKGDNGPAVLEDIMKFVTRWLYHHILGSDILIGKLAPSQENKENKQGNVFDFSDRYRTGIDFIDAEHETLFDIIRETDEIIHNEFLADKYDSIMNILYKLKDYTQKHFADEEEYMKSINYEGLWSQKLAHEAFVDRLAGINLDEVDDNQQEYLDELIMFLLNWLINHIMMSDKLIPAKA